MSVTVHQQPASYTPANNDQIFVATSTQTAVSDFNFRIVNTDVITTETRERLVKNWPLTTNLTYNAVNFSKNYIQNYIPKSVYGWKRCENAIRKITVNIGERYSSTNYTGTDYSFFIWNGFIRPLPWTQYNYLDYVYSAYASNLVYLSSLPSENGYAMSERTTYDDRSLFLYVLTRDVGDFQDLVVNSFDSDGNQVGQSFVQNPWYLSSTYTDKYLCIDVGLKGLNGLGPSEVTGTYPVIPATTAYYELQDRSNVGSPPSVTYTNIGIVRISCEPKFTVYTLHYKAISGNFETLHFNKMSEYRERVEKKHYRPNAYTLSSNTYSYSNSSMWEKCISSTGTENIIMNTDWMNEDQVVAHKEIISSPEVYIDYGNVIGLVPVKVLTSEILENKEYNNKLFGITLEVEPTYRNNYGV